MNYLEELELPRNLPESERSHIEKRLGPLLPAQKQLLAEATALAQETRQSIAQDQLQVIKEIHNYNGQLVKPNETLLHDCINKEKEARLKLDQFRSAKPEGKLMEAKPAIGDARQREEQLGAMRLQIIDSLEQIDFPRIAAIHKIDEVWGPSFHKVWMWVLEVYFGFASSKYAWEDFSRKAMSKKNDGGKELTRRMIVFDPSTLTPFQNQELDEIVNSHRKLLLDKTDFPEFNKFLNVLKLICEFNKAFRNKGKSDAAGKESLDVLKMRDEEERTLMASQKLNQTRFDLISEVHNLLLLIDTELK